MRWCEDSDDDLVAGELSVTSDKEAALWGAILGLIFDTRLEVTWSPENVPRVRGSLSFMMRPALSHVAFYLFEI